MTTQVSDIIIHHGEKQRLHSHPLEEYFQKMRLADPSYVKPFPIKCTSAWRGYQALWEIKDQRLYLVDVNTALWYDDEEEERGAALLKVFPDSNGEVLADWFSDVLHIPQGEPAKRSYGGRGGFWTHSLTINVREGIVVDESVEVQALPS